MAAPVRSEREIDGQRFSLAKFSPLTSLHLQARLFPLAAPALAAMAANESGVDSDILPAVQEFAKHLQPDAFVSLCVDLLKSTSRMGDDPLHLTSEQAINIAFVDHPLTLYKVLAFVLEENFKDFFGEAGTSGLLARLRAKKAPQPAPSIPT